MNFDASFIQETNHGSMGAIIRDHSAAVICSMSKQLPNCGDVEEEEARALLQGLQMCVQYGIFPTEVETDCAAVFSAVNDTNQNLSKICFIYREIGRIRNSVFHFSMSLVKRDCNTVAHELARVNRVEGTEGFWFETVSNQISPFVCDDCNKLVHE
jgi:ribonuclease HI